MKLNTISDNEGARRPRKRLGRGIGSGLGKTAGRGGKGQTARSGGAKAGFEGGQMPIYRRLPKRGFKKPNALHYNEVNLGRLQQAIDAGKLDAKKPIDAAALLAAGLVGKPRDGVRLLGKGELKAKVDIHVDHASKAAAEAVAKAGGKLTVLAPPKPEASEGAAKG
ncbi:MAG: 50S ribosomal protein L15 [Hyphomicrobiales bacterium]